jgi:hypothetical protein
LSRDLSIGLAALDNFVYQNTSLAPEALQAIALELFNGHARYDPTDNVMRSVNQEPPRPGGIAPEPFDPTTRPQVAVNPGGHVPYSVKGKPMPAARAVRPGRAE